MIKTQPSKIRVVVVDDHPMMLMGIKNVLVSEPQIEIVGEAMTGSGAIEKAKALNPHIVIMDINLPDMSGIDATTILRREAPDVKIIILSMYEEREYVAQFIQSGASGYVLKKNPPDELLRGVHAVYKGDAYFSPSIANLILEEHKKKYAPSVHLTDREREVLVLIAKGLNTKEIAEKLFISLRTVAKHRELMMQKLSIHSTAELVKYAISKKLITL